MTTPARKITTRKNQVEQHNFRMNKKQQFRKNSVRCTCWNMNRSNGKNRKYKWNKTNTKSTYVQYPKQKEQESTIDYSD